MSDSPGDLSGKLFARFKHIPNGFFIEAGANNGLWQNNTHAFEQIGWKGILIEPNRAMFEQCAKNRPNSLAFHCALVGPEHNGNTISGFFYKEDYENALCGQVKFEGTCPQRWGNAPSREVPARMLKDILAECGVTKIDLLSLDVEGYEIPALDGMNLSVYRPRFAVLETAQKQERCDNYMIANGYKVVEQLTGNDTLYEDERAI